MPQIRMKVGGMEYAINSDDSEEYVKTIGAKLDARLDALARKNPFLSTTMVAVLAALEAYDEAKKNEQEIERLRIEIKKLLEENAMSKMTAAMANRRLEEVLSEREPIVEEEMPLPAEEDEEEFEKEDVETEENCEDLPFKDGDADEQSLWDDDLGEIKISEDETGQYGIF